MRAAATCRRPHSLSCGRGCAHSVSVGIVWTRVVAVRYAVVIAVGPPLAVGGWITAIRYAVAITIPARGMVGPASVVLAPLRCTIDVAFASPYPMSFRPCVAMAVPFPVTRRPHVTVPRCRNGLVTRRRWPEVELDVDRCHARCRGGRGAHHSGR